MSLNPDQPIPPSNSITSSEDLLPNVPSNKSQKLSSRKLKYRQTLDTITNAANRITSSSTDDPNEAEIWDQKLSDLKSLRDLLHLTELTRKAKQCFKRIKEAGTLFNYIRLTGAQFQQLLGLVGPVLLKQNNTTNTASDVLPPDLQLFITLRYLANGESIESLHKSFAVDRNTVRRTIRSICFAIQEVLQATYLPDFTQNRLEEIADGFKAQTTYPHVIGAIDLKRISFVQDSLETANKIILLLVACDANSKFTYVDFEHFTKETGAGVFRSTKLGKMLDKHEIELPEERLVNDTLLPYYFLANGAFPLRPYLMIPFQGNAKQMQPSHTWHNREHYRGCSCIDNALGILAARWHIFLKPMDTLPESADWILRTTFLLHNFIMETNDELYADRDRFGDRFTSNGERVDGKWRRIMDECRQPLLRPLQGDVLIGSRNAVAEAYQIRKNVQDLLNIE